MLVNYPYADPVDRPVGWVHSLCTRDWILWLDDDEIPSAGLLAAVPAAIADRSVTHCFVPRRTLWRDAGSALLGPPWVPDFQLRLVQNDARARLVPGHHALADPGDRAAPVPRGARSTTPIFC